MFNKFQVPFHIPGQLNANLNIRFIAPTDCKLVHVSSVQSDPDAAGLEVGTSSDADGFITKYTIGVSDTPNEKKALSDFDGALADGQFPIISSGDIITLVLDYDHNDGEGGLDGTASDITVVLTFVEG